LRRLLGHRPRPLGHACHVRGEQSRTVGAPPNNDIRPTEGGKTEIHLHPVNYYNEHDPKAAEWLRQLIAAGQIPPGHVDERDILKVHPSDLSPFTQCHFFAGVGGWPLALDLAGVDSTVPLWTGSCPCQPFSVAGKGLGTADERHLWPVFANLVRECRPPVVFGEQVASKAGREWLAGVRADLERMGYAVGAADLCAAGASAPHIRQRLYWGANPHRGQCGPLTDGEGRQCDRQAAGRQQSDRESECGGATGRLADANGRRFSERRECHSDPAQPGLEAPCGDNTCRCCGTGGLDDSFQSRLEGYAGNEYNWHQPGRECEDAPRPVATASGAWDSFDILPCLDGKTRRIESGTFPLAHGVPGRVGLLRGYGNAIVPQVAATFIEAFLEAVNDTHQ
jgi:DNA (cytosine-5)-methyltransferase 1